MSIDESDRYHLFEVAREKWGDEAAAATLMNLLPPDRDQLATKVDLSELRAEFHQEFGALRAELHQSSAELTRTLFLAIAGLNLTTVGLAFAAARLA